MSHLESQLADKNTPLSEEFYQISPPVLESFPRYRPPLNLYFFNEKVNDLQLYVRAGERISKEKQEEMWGLCKRGNLFVARSDYPIYSKHISKQLDLILLDTHLMEHEIAEILWMGIPDNLNTFFLQPVKLVFKNILPNLLVVSEYLKRDPYKILGLIRRVRPSEELAIQSANVLFLGMALYLKNFEEEINPKYLQALVIGLSMVYVGKTKIPDYLWKKKTNLSPEEEKQLRQYPIIGASLLEKFGYREKISIQCILEHAEKLDGSGFPRKLTGSEITLPGRIASIASAFNEVICKQKKFEPSMLTKIARILSQHPEKFDRGLITGVQPLLLKL